MPVKIEVAVRMVRVCSSCIDFRKEDISFAGWCVRYAQIRISEQTCDKWKGARAMAAKNPNSSVNDKAGNANPPAKPAKLKLTGKKSALKKDTKKILDKAVYE